MKKISSKAYLFRKIADYLGVGLLLFLLWFLWVLYRGPLSVDFLKPYVMQALNSQDTEYSMNIGEVNLELVRSIQPVKIIAKDVTFKKNDDKVSIKAPSLSLSFSVRALLKGIIAPSSVSVENPKAQFFTSYGIDKEKTNEINKKKLEYYVDWFEGFLERFNSDEMIYPESFIKDISINNASVEFHEVDLGRKLMFKEVDFVFDRNISNLELSLNGLLDKTDRLITLELKGDYKTLKNKLLLGFNFSDFMVSDFFDNQDSNGLKIEVPMDGQITTEINFNEIINNKDDVISNIEEVIESINFKLKGGDGEVIFKKYSPIVELNAFAAEYAETLQKTAGMPIFICDRDAIIAVSGASKREYLDRKISRALEEILDSRSLYVRGAGKETISLTDDGSHYVSSAMPIIAEGDITGAVVAAWQYDTSTTDKLDDAIEAKLIQTAGLFLAKQLEV